MAQFSLSAQTALFKTKFGKLSENAYNSANVVLGRIKKEYNFVGEDMKVAIPTMFAGGVGSGSLPTANPGTASKATITSKKVYAVTEIEREAVKASMGDEGAFVQALKYNVQRTVEAFNRNASRILFGDGTGALGVTTAAAAGGSAVAPTIVISTATWNEANWEEGDYIMLESSSITYSTSNIWEITAVTASTRTITLSRIAGTVDLTGNAEAKTVYMQFSKNNDPLGLKGVCDATSSTLYAVNVGRRWQSTQQAAGGAGISTDRINQLLLDTEFKCGKVPNLIVTSFTQFRKILNLLEDQKQYCVEPRSEDLKGKLSFRGVEFMSTRGPIGIFAERFCDADRLYAINDNFIWAHHRPDFGWFDDDGTVFLRSSTEDAYGARYGGYYQNYIVPTFHGVIDGLST